MPGKKDSRPTLISLFTGAGGLDIGLEQAGFRTLYALDVDEDCVATLRHNRQADVNIPGSDHRYLDACTVLDPQDVTSVSARQLRPAGATDAWQPDLLAGGPPCQPFSSAGKMRSVEDPRGRLFESFVRLARELKPRRILFENVRGLVTAKGPKGEPGEVLDLVRTAFEQAGYATSFALLNAADYGLPQRRVRCFMFGSRRDNGEVLPAFPEPTHEERPGLFRTLKWVSLGKFLEAFEATHGPPTEDEMVRPSPSVTAQLRNVEEGSGLRSMGAREATRPGGHWGYKQWTFIADRTLPARTVTAAQTQDWVRLADGSLRRLTLRECAQLQGFPGEWEFLGAKASRFRQVGNAVPSIFGRILGEAIRTSLTAKGSCEPVSKPYPEPFMIAIRYTKKENVRNGKSRRSVRELQAAGGVALSEIKGRGSADS